MKLRAISIAIALAGIASVSFAGRASAVKPPAASGAQSILNPQTHLVTGLVAGRIVGTYQSTAHVRKCGSAFPFMPVMNTMTFQAGGTVIESPRFPPAGAYNIYGIPGLGTRTIGLGTWWYNPFTHTYSMTLRYDYFIDGVFHGTGTVDRDIKLSADGNTASGPVQATVNAADNSVVVELCGDATSTRL